MFMQEHVGGKMGRRDREAIATLKEPLVEGQTRLAPSGVLWRVLGDLDSNGNIKCATIGYVDKNGQEHPGDVMIHRFSANLLRSYRIVSRSAAKFDAYLETCPIEPDYSSR